MKFTSRSISNTCKIITVSDMLEIDGVYTHEEIVELLNKFKELVDDLEWAANATAP